MRRLALFACLGTLLLAGCQTPSNKSPAAGPDGTKPPPTAKADKAATSDQPAANKPAEGETATSKPAPAYDEGPLKAEIIAMREMRLRWVETPERGPADSMFDILLRVQGEPLKRLARVGTPIFTELVADTGQSLIDADTYKEQDKTVTRPVPPMADRLRERGLELPTRAKLPQRGTKVLTKVQGYIHLILADQTEKLTIVNPQQFVGGLINDPRLSEKSVEIRLAPASEFSQTPPGPALIVQMKTKPDYVKELRFYDGAMQPVPSRQRPVNNDAGEEATAYSFDNAYFNDELQLVIEVYTNIEDVKVPIQAKNVDLP